MAAGSDKPPPIADWSADGPADGGPVAFDIESAGALDKRCPWDADACRVTGDRRERGAARRRSRHDHESKRNDPRAVGRQRAVGGSQRAEEKRGTPAE